MAWDKDKARSAYAEKLRDPRWQKMRLEIMQRDDFKCRRCGDDTQTLNVHHSFYTRGAQPWEYESRFLVTLCETCHQEETDGRPEEEQALLQALKRIGATYSDVNSLACDLVYFDGDFGFYPNQPAEPITTEAVISLLGWFLRSRKRIRALVDLKLDYEEKRIALQAVSDPSWRKEYGYEE